MNGPQAGLEVIAFSTSNSAARKVRDKVANVAMGIAMFFFSKTLPTEEYIRELLLERLEILSLNPPGTGNSPKSEVAEVDGAAGVAGVAESEVAAVSAMDSEDHVEEAADEPEGESLAKADEEAADEEAGESLARKPDEPEEAADEPERKPSVPVPRCFPKSSTSQPDQWQQKDWSDQWQQKDWSDQWQQSDQRQQKDWSDQWQQNAWRDQWQQKDWQTETWQSQTSQVDPWKVLSLSPHKQKATFVDLVKEFQRTSKDWNDSWHGWCDKFTDGTRDPEMMSLRELQWFICSNRFSKRWAEKHG